VNPPGPAAALRRAAFLDRDGVVNVDHGYVWQIADFEFLPGTLAAARELSLAGHALVVVTNQAGIGRGMYTEADFARLSEWMREQFDRAGAPLAGIYHCPHHPTLALGELRRRCDCRKPAPGMILDAARDLDLNLANSVMFGDKCDDMQAALAAGVGTRVFVGKDGHAVPDAPCEAAGLRFQSLAQAVADPGLRQRLGLLSSPGAPQTGA